jgi:hypothetical protein
MAKKVSELAKGAWSIATAYTPGDFVTHGGASYVCILNSTGNEPPNATYWALIASKGDTGSQGAAGEEIQLQVSGGYIQWKYTSNVSWTNLIAVATLKGDKGDTGNTGAAGADGREVELQKTATHIQWRYVGEVSWTNLVALTDITGPQGIQGIQGEQGDSIVWKGTWSGATAYVLNDVVFSGGNSYICIQAHTNHEPPNASYWELVAQKGVDGEGAGDVVGPASAVSSRIAAFDGVTGKLLKDGGKTIAEVEAASIPVGYLDTDGALTANSDTKVATQKATKTYADTKVAGNVAITGATKTKITYDAKGLVTSGADASTADIADSTNKRYVTDAQLTVIGNTSGTNTGDQTLPVKATGAELDTGTDDAKFATAKAIADSSMQSGWTPARETWTYASADDPTFTFTIAGVDLTTKYYPGMRIKLTQTTVKYFIITKVAFSTDTTITVYGGTDYDLANAAITSPYYSTAKAPAGFPLDTSKWSGEATDNLLRTQDNPTANTWYNVNSNTISVPIGLWRLEYMANVFGRNGGTAVYSSAFCTLSAANNSESDADLTSYAYIQGASGSNVWAGGMSVYRTKIVALASKTPYYLNFKSEMTDNANNKIGYYGNNSKTILRYICAYL